MIKIREYTPSDLPEIAQLFYDTVHTVNAADYDDEQLDAWADGNIDMENLTEKLVNVWESSVEVFRRTDFDEQGNPYPLLYVKYVR